jgi:hypothetical protein
MASKIKTASKTYKFAALKQQAERQQEGREARKTPPPFVFDDVEPPIVITAPDTVERQLVIAEMIGPNLEFAPGAVRPLLKALCGKEFPRVWALVKDDTEPDLTVLLITQILEHFKQAGLAMAEAADLPGGSEASSS